MIEILNNQIFKNELPFKIILNLKLTETCIIHRKTNEIIKMFL